MDTSRRRCFLEVYTDDAEEPRLLQLEPNVKFHNVLDRFDEDGDLYWQERPLDPEATPVTVGMPCGVDDANALWFVPVTASYDRPSAVSTNSHQAPAVESTAAMRSSPSSALAAVEERFPVRGRASSLPAYFDASAGTPPSETRPGAAPPAPAVSWYSRPRLLSPAQPAVAAVGLASRGADSPREVLHPPSPVRATPANPSAALSPAQVRYQQQQPPRPPPPPRPYVGEPAAALLAPPPPPPVLVSLQREAQLQPLPVSYAPAGATRRNRAILIDPAVLVDDDESPVEVLQAELRRLARDVRDVKQQQQQQQQRLLREEAHRTTPPRRELTPTRHQVAVRRAEERVPASPSPIPASPTDPSVEELAMELHDKQMHRLYEQRRFYLTGGQLAS